MLAVPYLQRGTNATPNTKGSNMAQAAKQTAAVPAQPAQPAQQPQPAMPTHKGQACHPNGKLLYGAPYKPKNTNKPTKFNTKGQWAALCTAINAGQNIGQIMANPQCQQAMADAGFVRYLLGNGKLLYKAPPKGAK